MKLLKQMIPLGIIAAGALSLSACSEGGQGFQRAAETAACNGFHQWQRTHDPAALMSATNNLDFWVRANDSPGGGRGSSRAYPDAFQLDGNMDALDLLVQEGIGNIPAATKSVANNCNGNYGGSGSVRHQSSRLVIVFIVMVGFAILIVVTALALWIRYSIKYRASE